MEFITYLIFGAFLLAFLALGGFGVFQAFKYDYISPRARPLAWTFVAVSSILLAIAFYFLIQFDL